MLTLRPYQQAAIEAIYGYFEDRRPASNADPYRVTKILMTSIFGKL